MDLPPSLPEVFEQVERRRRTVTVFSMAEVEWLDELLGSSHVTVERRSITPGDVQPFLTVRAGDEYLGSVRLRELEVLVSPEIARPGAAEHVERAGQRLREMLADTVFSTLDRRQLVAASREIEDRAWRVGHGSIHTGFQSLSALRAQASVYAGLSDRRSLDVHVYGRSDWDPGRDLSKVFVHASEAPEVTDHWFVAYDGGGDDFQKCALLAEQVGETTYRGFWTYDHRLVDGLLGRLRFLFDDDF